MHAATPGVEPSTRRPFPAAENLVYRNLQRIIRLQPGQDDAGLLPDDSQHLIEFMRQPGCQATDSLELLSFSQLSLQPRSLHHALTDFLIRAREPLFQPLHSRFELGPALFQRLFRLFQALYIFLQGSDCAAVQWRQSPASTHKTPP